MGEMNEAKRPEAQAYDYAFNLEEQLRNLHIERQVTSARISQLQIDLERARRELNELKSPPLIVGTINEVLPNGSAIVRNSNGMDFLVNCLPEIEHLLESGKRVAMNQRTLVITQVFSESRDWRVNAMEIIERPNVAFEDIGGLEKEIRELEEAVILPLTKPELFEKLGIEPPNGVLLHGKPGTGKTMLAKAVANRTNSAFLSLSGSDLVRKYIGEGSRLVRDLFSLAKEKRPAIIFIDEIDSVASHRYATANGDREVQRTLMQLLAEMDGFDKVSGVKIIAATNRIDMLDPALLRPGRFDRIIEVSPPSSAARAKIFELHARKMNLDEKLDLGEIAEISDGFTGADIKAVCTEAGMLALRKNKGTIGFKEFNEAVQKLSKQPEEKPEQRMFS